MAQKGLGYRSAGNSLISDPIVGKFGAVFRNRERARCPLPRAVLQALALCPRPGPSWTGNALAPGTTQPSQQEFSTS